MDCVFRLPTEKCVIASAAQNSVTADLSVNDIIAIVAFDKIRTRGAMNNVVAIKARQNVRCICARKRIIRRAAGPAGFGVCCHEDGAKELGRVIPRRIRAYERIVQLRDVGFNAAIFGVNLLHGEFCACLKFDACDVAANRQSGLGREGKAGPINNSAVEDGIVALHRIGAKQKACVACVGNHGFSRWHDGLRSD